jgi:hypothetical protein
MRFSDIAKGTLATKAITLPLHGAEHPLAVRPLNGAEQGDTFAAARAYAVSKGVAEPKPGDRLYDLGLMAATIALGCVCSDDATKPFFDGGQDQILAHLDADRIALLYEQHQAWQDECSPRASKMSGAEFFVKVMEVANAKADEDPLARLRPSTRLDWERTLAGLYMISLQDKSSSGESSESSTTSAPPSADGVAPDAIGPSPSLDAPIIAP